MNDTANSKKDVLPSPLARFEGQQPPAPDWFARALNTPSDSGTTECEGATIAWKAWGARGQPGLILIHGGVAHKQWWDALGPFLARRYRVVALDLSGMGDSGWRDAYRMELYAEEVRAAGKAGGAFDAGKPFIAGHSFGGFVVMMATMTYGAELKGAIVLDSPIKPPEEQRRSTPPQRGGKVYESFEYALTRFRLLPHQPCENDFLLDHVARQSLRREGDGWIWKFDPNLWPKLAYNRRDPAEMLKLIACPLAFIRGSESELVTDEVWDFMRAAFKTAPMVSIPEAQHHLILDQPLAVVTALDALMASGWGQG
ncbi:MAG: alpha/beta hydrolase [Maricaulis sp.]|jgi:pimeloyl-ACP methyl ester carboxylesterase|nr:alpha/beta hydrolase [Maricaulis sp.]